MRRGGGGAWSVAWRRTREQLSQPLFQAEDGGRRTDGGPLQFLCFEGCGEGGEAAAGSGNWARGKKGEAKVPPVRSLHIKGERESAACVENSFGKPHRALPGLPPPSILPTVYKPHRGGKGAGNGRELFVVVVVVEGKSRTIPFPFSLPPESVFGCLLAWERPIGSLFLLPSSSPSLPQCCDLKGKKSGGIKKGEDWFWEKEEIDIIR